MENCHIEDDRDWDDEREPEDPENVPELAEDAVAVEQLDEEDCPF